MVRTLLLQNQRANDLVAWYAANWGLRPIIVCSNDDPGLTLTYFTASQIWSLMLLYGETVRKSFNGRNLQQMARVTKGLCLY